MKRVIKIFVASSITEFERERESIENFIRRLSDNFEDRYDVKIRPVLCENLDDAYSTIRKQEEYNDQIRESEFCYFLFFTKAGEYTREEFDVARKQFESTGKPKIYTYFKVIRDEKVEDSLGEFMAALDKTFNHYYGQFEHIDTVKLRILLNLKLQELDFVEVKIENGECVVDGAALGRNGININNVAEFANNKQLAQMQDELKTVEEEYYRLKPEFEKGGCSNEFYSKYSKIASRRQALIDEIEQLQKLIFNMSLRMSKDEVRGEITVRQKEAYRLFELGDYEGCMAVLDSNEIDGEFERKRKMLKDELVAETRKYIREYATKIEILSVMTGYSDRFREITECYEKIVPLALTEKIELDVVYDYADFLYEQNRNGEKIIELLEKLEKIYAEIGESEQKVGRVFNLLAISYDNQNQPQKAEGYYLKAIAIRKKLASENSERFSPDLAVSYNNAGAFYHYRDAQKAEDYYLKAIAIREKLASEKPERYNPDLADSYNNAGEFYRIQEQPQKAEGYYLKAIAIYEKLASENPERFKPYLANGYNNAGNFYAVHGQTQKAEEYYLKAIAIREKLASENSERFSPDLAMSYNNTGVFYADQGQPQKAEEYYSKAIAIYEKLAAENPERFCPDLAASYNNAGAFYHYRDAKKAGEYYLKAIAIYEKLASENPERYNPDLAVSYNNAGVFYKDQGQAQKAEEYYLKAIAIREKLVAENPERFSPDLADSYNNAGNFYSGQGQSQKAEEYYLKAIEIYEKFAAENPARFNPDLAMSYINYANFKGGDVGLYKKAYDLALACPDHPICRQIIAQLEKYFGN